MNAAHLHLILNHIPILGSYAILLLIGLIIFKKDQNLTKLSLQLMVLCAGLMAATANFGGEIRHPEIRATDK